MPRIQQNLRLQAIGMLYAGMTMNAVDMNIGCSTPAIRHFRQRFQATWHTEDMCTSSICWLSFSATSPRKSF